MTRFGRLRPKMIYFGMPLTSYWAPYWLDARENTTMPTARACAYIFRPVLRARAARDGTVHRVPDLYKHLQAIKER